MNYSRKIYPYRTWQRLSAAGFPSALQRFLNGEFFIIMLKNAVPSEYEENRIRIIKEKLKSKRHGFISLQGVFKDSDLSDEFKQLITMYSLITLSAPEDLIIRLCKQCSQELYLHAKDGNYSLKTPRSEIVKTGTLSNCFSTNIPEQTTDDKPLILTQDDGVFCSLGGQPKYVSYKFAFIPFDHPFPDAAACDAWLPLKLLKENSD